jgi:REP element-mobilizing transposase RayT
MVWYQRRMIRVRRKRRVRRARQGELFPKKDKNGQHRGGRRPGAGRKPKVEGRAGARKKRRPDIDPTKPQHVTVRVLGRVGHLRTPHMYAAVRGALATIAKNDDFGIVHFSLQGNHIHLICEAVSREALWRGVKGFEIAAAKRINVAIARRTGRETKGQVFADRYHARALTSVRETRNALCYVLNNWRHHANSNRGPVIFDGKLDPYSSAVFFEGWKERTMPAYVPDGYDAPTVARPRTWLLEKGWLRGRPISVYEVPGVA